MFSATSSCSRTVAARCSALPTSLRASVTSSSRLNASVGAGLGLGTAARPRANDPSSHLSQPSQRRFFAVNAEDPAHQRIQKMVDENGRMRLCGRCFFSYILYSCLIPCYGSTLRSLVPHIISDVFLTKITISPQCH